MKIMSEAILLIWSCAGFIPNAYDVELPWFSASFQNSKRDKNLDCSCGDISEHKNDQPYPWQVLIYANNSTNFQPDRIPDRICSGTIVNDRIIVTSALCLINLPTDAKVADITWFYTDKLKYVYPLIHIVLVTSGKLLLKEIQPNQTLKVEKHDFHRFFAFQQILFGKPDMDIVMVQLSERLRFNKKSVLPVCLTTQYLNTELVDVKVFTGGWRVYTEEDTSVTPTVTNVVFEYVTLPDQHIRPRLHCRMSLKSFSLCVSESFLCTGASPLLHMSALHLDGAPVMTKSADSPTQYVMLGIHSLSYYLTFETNPAVSMESNVSGYLAKIEEISSLPEIKAGWCRRQPNDKYSKRNDDPKKGFLLSYDNLNAEWMKVTSQVRKMNMLPEITCACGVLNSKSYGRIQGGTDAKPYEYGWQVQILTLFGQQLSLCGGTVINDKVVLTAAHCVRQMVEDSSGAKITDLVPPKNVTVRIIRYSGVQYEDDLSHDMNVELVVAHLNFKETLDKGGNYDVALLILKERLDFKNRKGWLSPVCLPETGENLPIDDRHDAITIGWGRIDLGSAKLASKLQELNVEILSKTKCTNRWNDALKKYAVATSSRPFEISLKNRICAGTGNDILSYRDALQGDSGGPLIIPLKQGNDSNSYSNPYIQVGITSTVNVPLLQALEKYNIFPPSIVMYISVPEMLPFIDYHSLAAGAKWCRRG